jgi:hypothetical protein
MNPFRWCLVEAFKARRKKVLALLSSHTCGILALSKASAFWVGIFALHSEMEDGYILAG